MKIISISIFRYKSVIQKKKKKSCNFSNTTNLISHLWSILNKTKLIFFYSTSISLHLSLPVHEGRTFFWAILFHPHFCIYITRSRNRSDVLLRIYIYSRTHIHIHWQRDKFVHFYLSNFSSSLFLSFVHSLTKILIHPLSRLLPPRNSHTSWSVSMFSQNLSVSTFILFSHSYSPHPFIILEPAEAFFLANLTLIDKERNFLASFHWYLLYKTVSLKEEESLWKEFLSLQIPA